MTHHEYVLFDPLFDDEGAEAMVRLCERFGRYGMYSQESVESEIGEGLTQRHDAVMNYVRSGGRHGRHDSVDRLAARTNYFREEFAYGTEPLIDGVEPFLFHEGFVDAARKIHDRPVIEPAIVFANLMVPGQELALHTDVPEFRGANRKVHPQWLLVAMRHSGLFEDWRMPIATGVAWFHDCKGGEFAFYPDGPDGDAIAHEVTYNTALLVDTDSVFHGVDPIDLPTGDLPPLKPGMHLAFDGDERWSVRKGDEVVAGYGWDELRFSISWKAYCFVDEAERDAWKSHTDDLDLEWTIARLVDDLRERGRIDGPTPPSRDLAETIIDEYIKFPATPDRFRR
ncbi:MAG: hypothetical protein H0V95_01610, partial [Actinobacteria bacterium]|nr:hypothetical protein [Actinomycetota bacterium]